MRFLRTSIFADMVHPPLTTVVSEADLKDTIEATRVTLRTGHTKATAFTVFEVFETDRDLTEAVPHAMSRIDGAHEHNLAILFFWVLRTMRVMRDGGMIAQNPLTPGYPSPMSGDEATDVLEQVAMTPSYRPSVRVRIDCEDGTKLLLHEHEVTEVSA